MCWTFRLAASTSFPQSILNFHDFASLSASTCLLTVQLIITSSHPRPRRPASSPNSAERLPSACRACRHRATRCRCDSTTWLASPSRIMADSSENASSGNNNHHSNGKQASMSPSNGDDNPSIRDAAPDNNSVPKPKRLACMICRKRKLKCDGVRPSCSTCSRLGHSCAYDEQRRKSGPKRGYVKALEERLSEHASHSLFFCLPHECTYHFLVCMPHAKCHIWLLLARCYFMY